MSNHFPNNSGKISPYPLFVKCWWPGAPPRYFFVVPAYVIFLRLSQRCGCMRSPGGGDLFRVGVIVGLDVPDSQTNQSKEVWKLVQTGALLLCVLLVYIYWTHNIYIYNLRCIHIYLQISVTYWQRDPYVWQLAAYKKNMHSQQKQVYNIYVNQHKLYRKVTTESRTCAHQVLPGNNVQR